MNNIALLHLMYRRFILGTSLLLLLASLPAFASSLSWRALTPEQREALSPLTQQWDTLPEIQRDRLLETAKYYPGLTPVKKRRFHERLKKWSLLTPEQREAARKKYRALKKVPPEKREQVKKRYKEEQAGKASKSAGTTPDTPSTAPAAR